MRFHKHVTYQRDVGPGTDEVIIAMPLPPGSVLNRVNTEFTLIGTSGIIDSQLAVGYAVHAVLTPLDDPDSGATIGNVWDAEVSKPGSSDTIDLDSASVNAGSRYEPGGLANERIWDLGIDPEVLYHMEKIVTVATNPQGLNWAADATLDFLPFDLIKIDLKKRHRVQYHSIFMMAIASPDWELMQHSADVGSLPSTAEWMQIQYLDSVMEKAWIDSIALIESGAETPWDDLNSFIGPFLEEAREAGAGPIFTQATWRAMGKAHFDVSVPGRPNADGQVTAHQY